VHDVPDLTGKFAHGWRPNGGQSESRPPVNKPRGNGGSRRVYSTGSSRSTRRRARRSARIAARRGSRTASGAPSAVSICKAVVRC